MHFPRVMSGTKTLAVPTSQDHQSASNAAPNRSELRKNVNKFTHENAPDSKTMHIPAGCASPRFTDLRSPERGPWMTGVSASDSPGDVEPSQDIFWDPTSPHATGFRCTKVEISDLVNRIAPKDVKPHKSSLLQWIGDSAVPCTPDIAKQRTKKRSSRPNSVDDLVRLAKQFDENMQQDKDLNENPNIIINNNKNINLVDNAEQEQSILSCDSTEAELRALFDSSTQKVSGRLSQGSASSAFSPEVKPLQVMPSRKATKAKNNASSSHKDFGSHKCDDFDDDWDWDNDELLQDTLLMTIPSEQQGETKTLKIIRQSNTEFVPDVIPSTKANHPPTFSNVLTKSSNSARQALYPKPKTTNRSTFRLEPDPVIHSTTGLLNQPPESRFTAVKPSHKTEPAVSACIFSDNLWDDGDDALLYQVCDSVEKNSNSQPYKVNQSDCQDKINLSINQSHQATASVPITATNASANKQSAAFVRSKSLPVTSSASPNYQGWDKPLEINSIKTQISQSLPGNHTPIGPFSRINHNASTVKSTKSSHAAFKRNMSDSAVICKKVFVTSDKTGKCSAAEIERKKQEALARRRQRNSQNT